MNSLIPTLAALMVQASGARSKPATHPSVSEREVGGLVAAAKLAPNGRASLTAVVGEKTTARVSVAIAKKSQNKAKNKVEAEPLEEAVEENDLREFPDALSQEQLLAAGQKAAYLSLATIERNDVLGQAADQRYYPELTLEPGFVPSSRRALPEEMPFHLAWKPVIVGSTASVAAAQKAWGQLKAAGVDIAKYGVVPSTFAVDKSPAGYLKSGLMLAGEKVSKAFPSEVIYATAVPDRQQGWVVDRETKSYLTSLKRSLGSAATFLTPQVARDIGKTLKIGAQQMGPEIKLGVPAVVTALGAVAEGRETLGGAVHSALMNAAVAFQSPDATTVGVSGAVLAAGYLSLGKLKGAGAALGAAFGQLARDIDAVKLQEKVAHGGLITDIQSDAAQELRANLRGETVVNRKMPRQWYQRYVQLVRAHNARRGEMLDDNGDPAPKLAPMSFAHFNDYTAAFFEGLDAELDAELHQRQASTQAARAKASAALGLTATR